MTVILGINALLTSPTTVPSITPTTPETPVRHKLLTFTVTGTYTIKFHFNTVVNINNRSDIILKGEYDIVVGASSSVIPFPTNPLRTVPLPLTSGIAGGDGRVLSKDIRIQSPDDALYYQYMQVDGPDQDLQTGETFAVCKIDKKFAAQFPKEMRNYKISAYGADAEQEVQTKINQHF